MNCKYCHLNTHYIDKCPTIICKSCKDIGHPQWLCNQKKNIKTNIKINENIEKKYIFNDLNFKKKTEILNLKNINYYLKLQNKEWGDLIDI
jgi:hypothetical protein